MKNKLLLTLISIVCLCSSCNQNSDNGPTIMPTIEPTQQPTIEPTQQSTDEPTVEPTPEPVKVVELGELNNIYYEAINVSDKLPEINIDLIYSDDSISQLVLTEDMLTEVDFTTPGSYRFDVEYEGITERYEIFVYDEAKTITLDKADSLNKLSSYNTGSYCSYTKNSVGFEFYRAYKNTGTDLTSILPQCDYVDVDSLGGAIYNTTPMYQISNISITYKTSGENLLLSLGKTRNEMYEIELQQSNDEYTTFEMEVDYQNFFRLEALDETGYIKSLSITYLNANNTNANKYVPTEGYRLNPVRYEGTLVSQQSSVTVPILVEEKDDSYEVIETKTYTYFTYEDVVKDPSLVELAAYVEPLDVANYFIAFGTYPANYVYKKQFDTAKATFGSYTRCVSDYSRTDGYARSVPCAFENGKPHYYECDIALEKSYSRSNRGVGRLVVWEYGFDAKGYDDAPVAVYTDDHYATFTEYLNNGSWGERFNAEMNVTAYIHGVLKTLN